MASPLHGRPCTTSSASAPSVPTPSPNRRSFARCSTTCTTAAPHTPASLLRPSPSIFTPPTRLPRGWGATNPVFRNLIKFVRPHTIIELGTFLGAFALHMASISCNLSLPSLILCIDDFRSWPGFHEPFTNDVPPPHHADALLLPQFMLVVAAAGKADHVIPLPFSTVSALAALYNRADEGKNQREERRRWRADEGKNQREERRRRHPHRRGRGGRRQGSPRN